MGEWISEIPNTLVEKDGQIRLAGSECPSCKRVFFPARKICPDCLDEKNPMQTRTLNRVGKISSYSIAQVAPPGYAVPHVQAYVDLEEGVRIFSLLVEYGDEKRIRNGLPVEMVTVKVGSDEQGRDRLAYRFRPISEEKEL